MKVFLSWSGDRSRTTAEALHEWIPNVIQAVQPWMSAEDIEKGLRWSSEVATQLEQTRFGIICLTPENLEAPWILFEAGALSKLLDKSFVCPFLFGLEPTDVKGPLIQFQATKAEKADVKKLILTLYRSLGETVLSVEKIEKAFEQWWPELEDVLDKVPALGGKPTPTREVQEIVEEILKIVRYEARESASSSKSSNDSISYAVNILRSRLGDVNAPPEIRGALRVLRPAVRNGPYFRRKHRPEGKVVRARAKALGDGKWRAEVVEPEGEDRVMGLFFDCKTREIAETTADSLLQEGYPHSCSKEKCEQWGGVLPSGGKTRSDG